MDFRTMQYYLAITREGNISAAAEALHISQPALSRQIKELEEELGVTLFVRGQRRITLTEEGMVLRRRAEEMLRLMELTEAEISQVRNKVAGDIRIGAGESHVFHYISRAAGKLHEAHPDIRFLINSGDTQDLLEQLDNGLLDFALIFSPFDQGLYHFIELPEPEHFGLLMRKDSPFAQMETIPLQALESIPLILSRASNGRIFAGKEEIRRNVVATYNLIYNASLLVEDGVGYAIGFDGLINTTGDSPLTFRPLEASVQSRGTLIWKKYQALSPAVRLFIQELRQQLE